MEHMIDGATIEVEDPKERQEKEKKILAEYYERFRKKNQQNTEKNQ